MWTFSFNNKGHEKLKIGHNAKQLNQSKIKYLPFVTPTLLAAACSKSEAMSQFQSSDIYQAEVQMSGQHKCLINGPWRFMHGVIILFYDAYAVRQEQVQRNNKLPGAHLECG